ncbi:MAG: tetratricopeptide repeat protein [Gammaproteobacteria bacterium]|nr:tetratricopeptide repeat protein [Gammaproteobacteria bacterium]
MSLLMDALRKAEEAKKKAAQQDKSDKAAPVTVAEKQQASGVIEKVLEDASTPDIRLSMEAMDEVSTRSAVPNLETAIEFEDEDDYVLPTSVGAAKESAAESDTNSEQSLSSEKGARIELEQINPRTGENAGTSADALRADLGDSLTSAKAEQRQASKAEHEASGFDGFESEKAAPDTVISNTKKSEKVQDSRVIVKAAEQSIERARDRDEPRRRTARRVFAAKRSPFLNSSSLRVAAGGGLALAALMFAGYFYISLNKESTFNIPAGSYSATRFVDDGNPSEANGDQLLIDISTVAETGETAVINAADRAPVHLAASEEMGVRDASAAQSAIDAPTEPASSEIVAVPETSRISTNLQLGTVVEERPQPETVIADTPEISAEIEVVVQPVANTDVQFAALIEPINLISFRKQEAVATVDENVGRAYAAYQQGSLDQAEILYRQALARDPRQRDALLGLANIMARNGNSTETLGLYSRLLDRNPSDPIARAGLMELLPAGSSSEQEAELKRLLNEHPDVAALSYAYGNFLALNQRWSEAQQAYFRALQLAKSDAVPNGLVNPDYAFNLAVSLEHLNQSEPAQNYYREALGYSTNHSAGFDLTAVRSRLTNLAGSGNDE